MPMPPLVLLALTLAAPIQKKDSQPPPRTIPELESRIRAVLGRTHTPAAGIALVTRDSVLWVAGLGKADVASGRDATAETLFRIGSTSKAFVALLVLLAEQEGKLRLDDPVRRYAPEIGFQNRWEATDPVRIVNLLEHTTGWDDLALRDYANNDSTLTLRQGLAYTPATRTSRWRPGTRVAYCNSGPPVAAYIVEKLEGQTFETLVHDRLFVPIGMTSATYFPPEPRERLATLYHGDGKTPYPYWHILERPAGAINASPQDMAAYVRFLLNRGAARGHQVVPRAAIERMERPQSSLTARAGLPVGYGLHLSTYVADTGLVWVGHDGGVAGGLTVMAYRPDQGVGFAFMINSGNEAALREIDHLVRGFLTRDTPRPALPPAAPLSPLARAQAGWYVADNPRVQTLYFIERLLALAHVRVSGDSALTLDPLLGKATRYVPVTATLFRASDSVPTLALVNDSLDGRPQAIERMGYLLPRSYTRIAAPLVWLELVTAAAFLLASAGSVLFALVWVPRRLFGKLRGAPHLWVRAWPCVAALALFVPVLLFVVSADDAISRFGAVTVWSLSVFIGTLLFPVAAVAGLVTVVRLPRAELGRVLRGYALVASGVNVVAAAYLAWWGVIGMRTWG
jgi:CubicO group peptidase (beta-lactamase class C family)